jgi:hypothetical protein
MAINIKLDNVWYDIKRNDRKGGDGMAIVPQGKRVLRLNLKTE